MSMMLCCGVLRRFRGGEGSGRPKDVQADERSGAGLSASTKLHGVDSRFCCPKRHTPENSKVPPQTSPLTAPAAATETHSTSSSQPAPDAVPPAKVLPGRQDELACDKPKQPKPYAINNDLWAKALGSLKELEKGNVEKVTGDLVVKKATGELDGDNTDRKAFAKVIKEEMEKVFNPRQHDSTASHIIETSVSVLSQFVSVGDVVVGFDPVHAALPWAVVRSVLVIWIANSDLKSRLLTGIAKVASLLFLCDTYQQFYMASDPTLRPQDDYLGKLRISIVQAYAKSQLFLDFAVGCQHTIKLSESERQILQAAENCEKDCNLSNRANVEKLLKLVGDLRRIVQDQLQVVLEGIDNKNLLETLEWISPINYGTHHDLVKERRIPNTCEWLLGREEFLGWQGASSSVVLWLRGDPGTGKTFLTSKVIDHIQGLLRGSSNQERSPNQEGFAYFYCDRKQEEFRNYLNVLRSYVRQLSTTVGNPGQIQKRLQHLCHERRGKASHLRLDDCKDQLMESVNLYPRTTIVLDALDECEAESRSVLVKVIEDLLSKSKKPLKVFISSRSAGGMHESFVSRPNIEIQSEDNEGDIKKLLDKEVIRRKSWSLSRPEEIKKALLERSGGMFLWVNLQIQLILYCESDDAVRDRLKRLRELPHTLKTAYDEIYGEIKNPGGPDGDLADRAFMWVMCACTPLRSKELLSAIRLDSEQNAFHLFSEIEESSLLTLCKNLLILDSQRGVWRFSHLTAMEYFEKIWGLEAHRHVAKVCLKLLIERYKKPKSGNMDSLGNQHDHERKTRDIICPKHPLQDDPLLTDLRAAFRRTPGGEVLLFAGEHRDKHYEEYVAVLLRFRYPRLGDLSPGLETILIDSILYRYYRIQYERYLQKPEIMRLESSSSEPPLTKPIGTLDTPQENPPEPTLEVETLSHKSNSSLVTIDTDILPQNPVQKISSVATQASVATRAPRISVIYPKPPKISEWQRETICPICYKLTNAARSPAQWKFHVNSDLKPYVCVSGECSVDLQFAGWELWREHMRRTHGHFLVAHSEINEAKLASNSGIPQSHQGDLCPICGYSIKGDQELEPITKETVRVRFREGSEEDTGADSKIQSTNRLLEQGERTAMHVGHHLLSLAFFSLPFPVNDLDLDTDARSDQAEGGSSSRTSEIFDDDSFNFEDIGPVEPE